MTNKGEERRAALVAAGVDLLASQGWSGVTHRAVAVQAGANPGLVHYYFGGSTGLHRAVAQRAAQITLSEVTESLLVDSDEDQLLTGIERLLTRTATDPRTARLTTELVAATYTDPEIRELVTGAMRASRERIATWLAVQDPQAPAADIARRAAVLLAAIDGAVLHRLLDPDLDPVGIASSLAVLTGPGPR